MQARAAHTVWRRRLTVVVVALLLAAIGAASLLQGGSRPAGATGLVFGCPEGTSTMGSFLGIEIEAQRDGFAAPEELIDLDINEMLVAIVGPPEGRNLDVDEDGLPDLRWNVAFPTSNADTNLSTLWDRIGGDLSPIPPNTNPAPWLDIRVTLDRLPSDPTVVPYAVWGQGTFEMNTPVDPADPDGPFTTEITSARVGYDTRATDDVAPTRATFDVVISDNPPTNPDTGYLGARFATEYRPGNDPAAPLVTPGTEPEVTTLVQVGPETNPDRNLDLAVAWERAPAQLGFVKATSCGALVPTQTIAWDYRADQAGAGSNLPPTDADIDLVTGKAQGYANHDAFAIHATVEHVPEELTLDLTETNALLRQNQHEVNGAFPDSSPAPNLVLDELLVTGKPANPGEAPTKLRATGRVTALPPVTNLAITTDLATGAMKSTDLRFCPGTSWSSAACQADVRAPDSIELIASDVLPGESTTLPALPAGTDPFVAYTERDRGGILSPVKDKHFRFGGRLAQLQHLNVVTPPAFTQQGVVAKVQLAANLPKAKLVVDSDRRKVTLVGGQATTTESAIGFSGDIAPFPAKATVAYAKTIATPVVMTYDFDTTKAAIGGSFSYDGNTADDTMQVRGQAALGDAASGLPTKGSLVYKELAGNLKQVDYNPNAATRAKVGMVLSTASDRTAKVRRRVWADGTLGGRVVTEWRSTPLDGFNLLDVRPCLTAPCPASTALTKQIQARIVSGAPIKDEEKKLLDAPDLPAIDHPDVYPAFTKTPRGVTYVRLHDGQWGASAELGVVKHLRFEDTGMTAGQKVCLESADDKPADPAFGTRIYLNASGKRTDSEPEKPLYVDGVLSRLPEATDVRINDEGSAADANKPWLWLNTKTCGATQAPGREGKPGPADIDFTALVKAGDVKAQTVMTSDPLGKAPLALPKPDATTPLGANVHALVDGVDRLAGFDVAAHLEVPEHTVVYRPTFQACDEGAPLSCQDLPAWTRRERLDAGLRVMSTGTTWGSVDALVRMRSLLPVDNAPGPQAPNVCTTNAVDGRSVCDLDVIAHLASVPAKFLVQGQLATNARQPDAGLTFKVQNLAGDPSPYPKWDTATARVTDEAHPSATGVRTTSAGTPVDLYRVNLKGIAHELTAKVRFQGNETLPPNANVCPAHSYAGRGPMDLGYVDADLDVAGGTSVTANARIDVYGRFYANVVSPTALNGTVRSKIENVAVGEKFEQEQTFSTNDVDVCVDLDLPFEVQLTNTKDARISIDKTTWAMQVPAADPTQKMTLRVGEMHNGSWLAGAVWFEHEAHFDPEGPGDWDHTPGAGRRDLGFMPTAYWNGVAWEAYYKNTKWNQISTNETFGLPAPLGCCVSNGATKFTMDLFWNQSIRNDMYCRDDDDFCYVSFPGRPGWEFHKSVYLKGHFPRTDAVTFAEQAPTNPPTTSASYLFTWANGTTMPGPNEAETSAWIAESNPVLTTADGNKHRVYLGVDPASANAYEPGDPVYGATTTIGIGADSANGMSRWRRELGTALFGSCGVDQPKPAILSDIQGDSWVLQCRLTGNMSILPSNHVQVTWKLEAFRVDYDPGDDPVAHWVTLSTGTKVFDPSGYGGTPDLPSVTVNAQAGQPVNLSSAFNAADITTGVQRKVWYFGDGSVFEGGAGTLPSVQTPHTYAHPGTYPATLVYYAFDASSKQWKVKHTIPQRIVVAP